MVSFDWSFDSLTTIALGYNIRPNKLSFVKGMIYGEVSSAYAVVQFFSVDCR